MYPQQRRRPNKRTDRLAWEESWERDIHAFYARPIQALPRPTSEPSYPRSLSLLGTRSHLVNLKEKARDICALQNDIVRYALPACTNDRFELKWTRASSQRRRELVLEGLYRASCRAWLEERRGLCPEFTLTSLSERNGCEYLRLLNIIIQEARSSSPGSLTITSPVLFPHHQVDYMWALPHTQGDVPGLKAWATDIIFDRTLFASMAIWYIFLAFHGRILQCDTPLVSSGPSSELSEVTEDSRKCQHCGKAQSSLGRGKQLRACGPCLSKGRRIYYCSRECQFKNWKLGQPTPHRTVCAKSGNINITQQETGRCTEPCIPEPEPSFQRSPALMRQITLLEKPPYVDYMFIFPHPHPDRGVTIRAPKDKRAFLTLREEALRSGNQWAVQKMYYMLIPFADSHGFPRGSLKKQLEREYHVKLQELPSSLTADTASRAGEWEDTSQTDVHADQSDEGKLPHEDDFPGALVADEESLVTRSAADRVVVAVVYYVAFVFLSLGVLFLVLGFLLQNPLLVIGLAPFLGTVFRALSNAFKAVHEWVWQE